MLSTMAFLTDLHTLFSKQMIIFTDMIAPSLAISRAFTFAIITDIYFLGSQPSYHSLCFSQNAQSQSEFRILPNNTCHFKRFNFPYPIFPIMICLQNKQLYF